MTLPAALALGAATLAGVQLIGGLRPPGLLVRNPTVLERLAGWAAPICGVLACACGVLSAVLQH